MNFEGNKRYFDKRFAGLKFYFDRFPHPIDFAGKRVLDFGCGHGALTVAAAESGATEVLGVDVNKELIEFAQRNQQENFPQTNERLRFEFLDILEADLTDFDLVISEATFEHVIDLDTYLAKIRSVLKPGGRLYTGYSPLYNAPFGDHHRLKAPLSKYLPWMHLVWPHRWLLKRLSEKADQTYTSLEDLGLNGLSFAAHREKLHRCNMDVVFFGVNNQKRLVMRCLEPLRAIPPFRELLSISIYAILQRPEGS